MTIGQIVVAVTKMMQNKFIYVHSNLNQVVRILLHFTTLSFVTVEKENEKNNYVKIMHIYLDEDCVQIMIQN